MDAAEHYSRGDAARKVAQELRADPNSATRTAGFEIVQQAMSSTSSTDAVAARLLQIKQSICTDGGQPRVQGGAVEAPAGPIAVTQTVPTSNHHHHQQQQQQRHVTISPATVTSDKPNVSSTATSALSGQQQQQQQQNFSEPTTSALTSVKTSQGPIVMTTPEETAQAQQALRLLNTYDFKIYGQGLSAGPSAEPLQPPEQKVLYKPDPVAPEPPLPPAVAAAATGDRSEGPAVAAAVAGSRERGLGTTPSGTPTVFMKPLPADAAAGTSRPLGDRSSPAAAAAAAPSGVDAAGKDGRVGMTLDQKQQQQQQHDSIQPSVIRRRKEQPPYYQSAAGPERRVVSAAQQDTAASSRDSSSSSSRGSRIGRWLTQTKSAVREAVEDAAAWLVHMLYLFSMWLLKIVMIPLRALFGPWYRFNRRLKTEQRDLLAQQQLDLSALHDVLGALPSWLSGIGGATEKVTWLNQLLAQIWPVLDPVVCELIRSTVEPMLDDMKPPFIAAMGFQKLTLGELPLELEGVRVVGGDYQGKSVNSDAPEGGMRAAIAAATADDDDRIEMEVDFRWVGEPNISFFVELAMAGPYTRMVPKVSHLTARGTMRLGLTRLVPQLPGFGALMVSMARTPQVKFSLDFGPALGGKFTAKPVAAFLDPFIRDTLANLLVWPNRFVVPILPRDVTGNLDDLTLHSQGVLEVEVLSAHSLPKKGGTFSTVDPQVELWTQPQHRVYTSVKKGSRNPTWRNQKHELLVQEPDSQMLRIVLNDIDMLNVKELLRVNLLKGAANLLRSAHPIGRAALPLREICEKPFKRQELELRLSGSEWAYELGVLNEEDNSTLKLAVLYKPFMDLDAASTKPISAKGVLFVDVRQCEELASGDYTGGSSDPYVLLKVAGQKQQTVVYPHTTSPVYNAHFEFFNVQAQDVLQVQVWDKDTLKPDDLLGQVELPVTAIVDWSQGGKRGWRDGWWKLKGGRKGQKEGDYGRIEMKVQFRPY